MKTIYTALILIFSLNLMAEDVEFFERQKESAHPTPSAEAIKEHNEFKYKIPYKTQELSKFINSVTTVNEEESQGLPTQNESSIAVNPTDPNNLIGSAVDYRDNSSTWVYVSSDAGKTWENINLGKVNTDWRSSNDPSVMFDKDGTGYLVHGAFPGEDDENGVYISRTTDKGKTWEKHIPVIEHKFVSEPIVHFEDKYYIQVDNSDDSPYRGDLYIPWKRVTAADSATQIVLTKSTDKGSSWSVPVNISERLSGSSEDTTFGQSFPLAATGPEGNVYVVWNHGIEHAVGFNKSTDGGVNWAEPRLIHQYNIFGTTKRLDQGWRHTVKGVVRAEAYPVIMTDYSEGPNKGNVYVAWAADSIPNIYFSKSTDEGESWTTPKIVHSETKNDQFWTWMGVDPKNGDIAIMYLDSRNDPDNILVECFVSYSSDGGETWIDRQISNAPSDLRRNPFQGNAFAGDYSGLDFFDGVIYPSWVDMRNTDVQTNDNDVYTAIVRVDQPSPVENFEVNIIAENPTQLKLGWETVWESTFGKTLNQNDFKLELYRNSELVQTFAPNTESYIDEGLEAFERYDYKLRAVSENDSSIYRVAFNYAGGTEKPDSVRITDFEVYEEGNTGHISTRLYVYIPTTRADKVTPLTNVKYLEVFADGLKIRDFPLVQTEIGTEVAVNITEEVGNYANFSCLLVAGYENPDLGEQRSDTSNSIFSYEGNILSFEDTVSINFDDKNDYYYSDMWQVTDEISLSAPNSISTSPNGKYENSTEINMYLNPISIGILSSGQDAIATHELVFDQIVMVHKLDSVTVDVSRDMKSWETIRTFSIEEYEQWQDGKLTNDDWVKSRVDLVGSDLDRFAFSRLRLKSNGIVNDLGWYVDNINMVPTLISDVEEQLDVEVGIYPNPTSNYLNISNSDNVPYDISIYDLSGNLLISEENYLEKSLNISKLQSGLYLIKFTYKSLTKVEKLTVIK